MEIVIAHSYMPVFFCDVDKLIVVVKIKHKSSLVLLHVNNLDNFEDFRSSSNFRDTTTLTLTPKVLCDFLTKIT